MGCFFYLIVYTMQYIIFYIRIKLALYGKQSPTHNYIYYRNSGTNF